MGWDYALHTSYESGFLAVSRVIGGYQVNVKEDAREATECLPGNGICWKSRLAKGARRSQFFGNRVFFQSIYLGIHLRPSFYYCISASVIF